MLHNSHKIITTILLFISLQSSAQSGADSITTELKPTTQITFGAGFASKLHYFGRTDSLQSSAFVPSVAINFTNGLYIGGSFIFINNTSASLAYTAAITEAGYKFGKNVGIAGSIYVDKFFYANSSSLVQSVQKGQAGFALSHLNKIIDINSGASAVFSDKTDFFVYGGIDHSFRKEYRKCIFLIVPSVTVNAGTQNFTKTYYKKRNVLFLPVADESVTESGRKFQVLSYEASIPVTFVYNKLAVSFIPAYVIPQNVIKVANRPDLSENASNLFYANIGVSYTLGRQ